MTTYMTEAERRADLVERLRAELAEARAEASAFAAGDEGEREVCGLLEPLLAAGWVVLRKRRWPGTREADLDLVLIGPPGVVVLDVKNWNGSLRFARGRLYRDQTDASDCLVGMRAQVEAVVDVVAEYGLAPATISGSVVFTRQALTPRDVGRVFAMGTDHLLRWLRALPVRFTTEQVGNTGLLLDEILPPAVPSQRPARVVLRRRLTPRPVASQEQLFEVRELDLAGLERVARLGLEDWMTYLHPSQLDIVRRRYAGPSRVRGPAGCGKSVVLLHRAAYLAGLSDGRVLVTSYVRTLPVVLGNLYSRLSPTTRERVDFCGVHRLASSLLSEAGVLSRLQPGKADQAWRVAWARCGDRLVSASLDESYWHEEVCSVVKGRALQSYEEYGELARVGRRTALQAAQRRAVWDLYLAYDDELSRSRAWDFDDLISAALDVVEQGHGPRYRHVLVDECQDLSLQALRLLNALTDGQADGLTLVGDGQQAIYPGGFTLKEAGISVAGRGAVLNTNYRNAAKVLERARDVVRMDDFDDLEDLDEPGERDVQVRRDGGRVLEVAVSSARDADVRLAERLKADGANGFALGGAGVLCRTKAQVRRVLQLLAAYDVPAIDLVDYDGLPVDAVKVGTVKRAKGLEFGRVYLPHMDDYLLDPATHEMEQVQRARRELFVAMTRARDGLWLCRLA